MTEIYVDTSQYIYFDLYNTTATGTPTAVLKRDGSPDQNLTVSAATAPTGVTQRWRAYISIDETADPGVFSVTWAAVVGGETITKVDYFEVVTPYVTPEELAAKYNWSFNPSDANYRSRDDVVAAERIARYTINSYTRRTWGPQQKTVSSYGQNTDVLTLTEPIVSISELYENGELVRTNTDFTKFGYDVEVTETGFGIRTISPDYLDLDEQESLRVTGVAGKFRQGYRYTVKGTFGSSIIPQVINDCTSILANDYLCKDASWRAKYINHVQMRDWKFNFEKEAFRGTGNLIVDRLLSDFRPLGFSII